MTTYSHFWRAGKSGRHFVSDRLEALVHSDPSSQTDSERRSLVGSALRLSCFTIVWNGVANSLRQMPVDGPFYLPDPELFGHPDAYPLFTAFASGLEEAGLAGRFPLDVELRQIAIELLAERSTVEEVEADQSMIEHAITEAQGILDERRR